jgi:hypothetical protein
MLLLSGFTNSELAMLFAMVGVLPAVLATAVCYGLYVILDKYKKETPAKIFSFVWKISAIITGLLIIFDVYMYFS